MIDEIDAKILDILQREGRTKRNLIAEKVGLSLPSVSERLQKLENAGLIEGYYAKLNKKKFGYDIMAFITVIMDSSKRYKDLILNVEKNPQIIECYSVLGEGSHILKAIAKDTDSLEKLLAQIQSWPGVVRTITSFVLSSIKETNVILLNK